MRVYWREVKRGQNLILGDDNDGHEENLGGFRDTKRGIDALAKTFSYEPERSRKGFPTIEEAKAFVESFRPWELYDTQSITVESEVRPALDAAMADSTETPDQPDETMVSKSLPTKGWWQFWK